MLVFEYHEATKHHFARFARALGYLDWASQPDPFRRFAGARIVELPRSPLAAANANDGLAAPITIPAIGEFLRCALGLSAWKEYGASRWALRVNPSSGNLHPTEGYVITSSGVFHYAPQEHLLEERCVLPEDAWSRFTGVPAGEAFLVALTSIHWREAWKYGERAFRYCQHDCGHAIAALRISAALLGWRLTLLPRWSDEQVTAVLGLDRDGDYADAEREAADCIAVVTRGGVTAFVDADPAPLATRARDGCWSGRANRLSPHHVEWSIIDRVAEATRYPGRTERARAPDPSPGDNLGRYSRDVLLRRRSALGFDGRSSLPAATVFAMLGRLVPGAPPWDAIWWEPHLHLALFIHRVEGLPPGIYAYLRDRSAFEPLRGACRPEFLWEPVAGCENLFLLVPIDCRYLANRLSCDQDIAEDGFFSLGMIAKFQESIRARGEWFYRNLFWESGVIGQVLYLEAEAAGARATGIGCYYDDPVHEVLGLSGSEWQSLYHFSVGVPVEDRRLTTEPGYAWE